MMTLLDLVHSPIKLNPSFYSADILSPNINSYNQYFQHKILQKHSQRHSSSKKKPSSKISLNQSSALSKDQLSRAKSSQNISKSNLKKKVKKTPKDYQVNEMYLSRVSQMASEISVPTYEPKISKQQLDKLQNRLMTELLNLREQKINALSGLNSVIDRKNKAVEILRKLEVMRQAQRMNGQEQELIEEDKMVSNQLFTGSAYKGNNTKNYHDMEEVIIGSPNKTKNNNRPYNKASRLSVQSPAYNDKSPINNQQHQYPENLINSNLSKQAMQIGDAINEVQRIKEELMKPLLNEHPLLIRNTELKQQLDFLKKQLSELLQKPKDNIEEQISYVNQENYQIKKQIQRYKMKLSALESKRFETFFPKDKEKLDKFKNLIETQKRLQQQKLLLEGELASQSRVILKRREDFLMIEQLKEENQQLSLNCERLMVFSGNANRPNFDSSYESMSLSELQNLVNKQQQNKMVVSSMLGQFRQKISNLQQQNEYLRGKKHTQKSFYHPKLY